MQEIYALLSKYTAILILPVTVPCMIFARIISTRYRQSRGAWDIDTFTFVRGSGHLSNSICMNVVNGPWMSAKTNLSLCNIVRVILFGLYCRQCGASFRLPWSVVTQMGHSYWVVNDWQATQLLFLSHFPTALWCIVDFWAEWGSGISRRKRSGWMWRRGSELLEHVVDINCYCSSVYHSVLYVLYYYFSTFDYLLFWNIFCNFKVTS